MAKKIAEVRKLIAYAVGIIATATTYGLLSGRAATLAAAVVAVAIAYGLYKVPNAEPTS